jgi:pimeloyl-ACP methyl ester carboxylesterase
MIMTIGWAGVGFHVDATPKPERPTIAPMDATPDPLDLEPLVAEQEISELEPVSSFAEPRTFVLVHGAWHGAWCWRRVADLLAAQGHRVVTPSLTGVGERSHLLGHAVDLDTQILDVVNEMKWRELKDVVLVGHSYGGMVVSGVAEKLEKSIASLVMLDAFFPQDGQALVDLQPPHVREAFQNAERQGALALPPIPAAIFNVNEEDRAWVDAQCTPHPLKCFTQKLTLTGARERIAKKAYIRATAFPNLPFDQALEAAHDKGWHLYELPCGHDVMIDMPERLAEILIEVA